MCSISESSFFRDLKQQEACMRGELSYSAEFCLRFSGSRWGGRSHICTMLNRNCTLGPGSNTDTPLLHCIILWLVYLCWRGYAASSLIRILTQLRSLCCIVQTYWQSSSLPESRNVGMSNMQVVASAKWVRNTWGYVQLQLAWGRHSLYFPWSSSYQRLTTIRHRTKGHPKLYFELPKTSCFLCFLVPVWCASRLRTELIIWRGSSLI